MSTESKDFDPYAIVLADLRAQRDKIDQAIQSIEAVRLGAAGGSAAPREANAQAAEHSEGAYLGMSISDATRKLLALRKKALNNSAILAELQAGGLVLTAAEPLNTIGAVLSRRFNEVGDIVRVDRGTWGLKEWYPNRSFNKPQKGGGNGEAEVKSGSSVNEQPSKPASDAPQP